MTLFKFKPTSPGVRGKIKLFNILYKGKHLKKNSKIIHFKSGRNNSGSITVRHKGGKSKRRYRYIDFFRNKDFIRARIIRIEYDPNRSSNICLLSYFDNEKRYIICPKGVSIGDTIISGEDVEIKIGNNLFLKDIPIGTKVHCVENSPGSGAKISRSSGCYCVVSSRNAYDTVLVSNTGKSINLNNMCRATIGEVGNSEHFLINYGKAGSKRLKGIRPTVRGVAMNPVDHPHGGGEGKTSGGRDPVTPWGRLCKSFK
ncbi:MAG: 50S ribosomal protein L2 [Candidatus Nasuia deltocephalinicola]